MRYPAPRADNWYKTSALRSFLSPSSSSLAQSHYLKPSNNTRKCPLLHSRSRPPSKFSRLSLEIPSASSTFPSVLERKFSNSERTTFSSTSRQSASTLPSKFCWESDFLHLLNNFSASWKHAINEWRPPAPAEYVCGCDGAGEVVAVGVSRRLPLPRFLLFFL